METEANISVIMPVYNAEKTIEKSIYSVLGQTISKPEIICIDDGSSDTSIQLIESLQERYPNIILLKQEHQGSGPARNAGIKAATGSYIAFLDADDEFVDTKALEIMVNACVENCADICGSLRISCENGEERQTELFKEYEIPQAGCFIEYREFQYDYDYQSFIFDRNFLVRNGIWFPPYMRYQDPPFFVNAMVAAERFFAVPITLYKYRCDPIKQNVVIRHVDHILQGIYDTLKTAKEKGYQKLFCRIVGRVDGQFRDAILQNLSDETMALLLSINSISRQFQGKSLNILTEIYSGAHETRNIKYSYGLMKKIVAIKQNKGFRAYFEAHEIRTVAVYGLGVYGGILVNELKDCGIKIVCGIDRKVSAYKDILIIRPDEDVPECDALIISLIEPESVVRYYEKTKNIKVIAFTQIINSIAEKIRTNREDTSQDTFVTFCR